MKVKEFFINESIYISKKIIDNPKISIIMPTYCRGDSGLLERSINTVMNQTFKEWELIIVDDGSYDSTRKIVENYINNDNRVVYIRNEINSGLPAVRVNQGILYSRGKYITSQFDDDQWEDTMLEEMYGAINTSDGLSIAYAKCKAIDVISKNCKILGLPFDINLIQIANFMPNNTVIHSRELPYLYGGYDCHVVFRRLADWDLWKRWSKYANVIFVDKVLSVVEVSHDESLITTCDINMDVISYMQSIDRNECLKLSNIGEYEVDSLDIISNENLKKILSQGEIFAWKKKHDFI